jgi:2-amino-4-hydroxy-6-hydroxymethyldihydropteridine diphosphokinase
MSSVYLSLGSNLGDKRKNIESALAQISERVGVIRALSGFHETQPWGYDSKETYLNVAIAVATELNPAELLEITQAIERDLGRCHKTINGEYQDRTIDIDLLLYDNLILNTENLTIPHPLMHQRAFVLQPLTEIAPHIIHPVIGKSITELNNVLHV